VDEAVTIETTKSRIEHLIVTGILSIGRVGSLEIGYQLTLGTVCKKPLSVNTCTETPAVTGGKCKKTSCYNTCMISDNFHRVIIVEKTLHEI